MKKKPPPIYNGLHHRGSYLCNNRCSCDGTARGNNDARQHDVRQGTRNCLDRMPLHEKHAGWPFRSTSTCGRK